MSFSLSELSIPSAGASVTPDDNNDLPAPGVLISNDGGQVKVDTFNGDTLTFKNIPPFGNLPVFVKRVYSTDTTSTDIIVLYDENDD